jgi:predicted RNA-binding protein YlqC (UPF0109 family)
MKELLEAIVKELVDKPEDVSISERYDEEERTVVFELSVAESDMGKVIGRQGRIAKAIRTIMKAASIKENIKVSVDIIG